MKTPIRAFFIAATATSLTLSLASASELSIEPTAETREAFDQRMAWWRDATFGMFIHWGAYAVPAGIHNGEPVKGIGEWIMQKAAIPVSEYEDYARRFNPTAFDADEWVRIARDAGMKYIIITSKHHDGFCLWDSKLTDYDVMDFAPIHRDLLGELKAACDRQGMILGFYHSIMDWHHPDAQAPHYPTYNTREKSNPNFERYVEGTLKPQIRELIENYDPAVLWFDGEWIPEWTHQQGLDLYAYVRSLSPGIIINNRVDKGRQGMKGMNRDDQVYAGDFGTPEQEILEGASDFDWESCMTMNDTWGFKSQDHNWKSAETLIHNLIDVAAKGGNYLLNVGPTAEGIIPAASVERLALMGIWLRTNEEAIHATERLARFSEGDFVDYTQRGSDRTLYAILTRWTEEPLALTQVVPDEGSQIHLLGYPEPLAWQTDGSVTTIALPPAGRAVSEHAWTLQIHGKERSD